MTQCSIMVGIIACVDLESTTAEPVGWPRGIIIGHRFTALGTGDVHFFPSINARSIGWTMPDLGEGWEFRCSMRLIYHRVLIRCHFLFMGSLPYQDFGNYAINNVIKVFRIFVMDDGQGVPEVLELSHGQGRTTWAFVFHAPTSFSIWLTFSFMLVSCSLHPLIRSC